MKNETVIPEKCISILGIRKTKSLNRLNRGNSYITGKCNINLNCYLKTFFGPYVILIAQMCCFISLMLHKK